jgi:hypothetical protein
MSSPRGRWPPSPAANATKSSSCKQRQGAPGIKLPGRVAVTRMTVPCGNDQSRRSWRTTGGTLETVVDPGCRGSSPRQ